MSSIEFCFVVHVQQTAPLILRDGNGAIYPVAKDCLDGIRDPLWLDMAPLCSLSMAIQSVPSAGALPKSRLAVIGLALEVCWLCGLLVEPVERCVGCVAC